MDVAELHRHACEDFGRYLRTVRDDQWGAPTPCEDWDVRALVNHVVAEDLWTPPLMDGATIDEIGDRFDGDLLGDDPVAAYDAAAEAAVAALSAPGALERTVHLSFGDAPADVYAWQLFADHLIHGWDLAQAVGADSRLDPELVEACATWFAQHEDAYREAGAIGPPQALPPDADVQTRLLAAFGRVDEGARSG